MRLLLVEDDAMIGEGVCKGLRQDGFTVDWARDGRAAELALSDGVHDLMLLDLGLPGKEGLDVLKTLRRRGNQIPVLVMTARDALSDRVGGLNAGADDYLVKPFALRELQARLRALLRRTSDGTDGEILKYADMVLDPIAHEVRRGERVIELSKTEFLLLELFMRHPRQVLTRSTIFENVWGYDFGPTSNALGVYMGYLRRKTEAGSEPRLLHTVRGVGYVLRD